MKQLSRIFRFSFIFALAILVSPTIAQPTDLFISEYIEGSSNNKALELYNGTSTSIDLGAGQYVVELYFNGNSTPSSTIVLTGTITSGSTYVIGHSSAVLGFTPNLSTSSLSFNGDDAIVLKKGGSSGTILDVIGQVGYDPGTQWGSNDTATADRTIRRKVSICQGDITISNAFYVSAEWDGYPINTFTGLGSHSVSCGSSSLSPGLTVSTVSLNFVSIANTPSAPQPYFITGTSLTSAVTITAPALFELSLSSGGPFTPSLSIPQNSFSTSPATVYARYFPLASGTTSGSALHTSGSYTANIYLAGSAVSVSSISVIQGSLSASSFTNQLIATEGVVTGDFQANNELGGFYIQDPVGDGNASTSEGIFVSNTSFAVNPGDFVRVIGVVEEYFDRTQIKAVSSVSILSTGNSISPVSFSLPVLNTNEFEKLEGMRVQFSQTLTVSEVYTLARYGELLLSSNGRLMQPTNFIDPNDLIASGTSTAGTGNVSAVIAQQNLNNLNQITLDDKSNVQNPSTVPYLDPMNNTLRCGSSIANLDGVMDYAFSLYRIQPIIAPAFTYAARPSVPSVGITNVKVASFNVLNYFNGDGLGGGFPTSRGASTSVEFSRQRNKIIAAISQLNADIVGLMEMENDGNTAQSAIQDLVNGLNTSMGANTYTFVPDPTSGNGGTGTDEIKVALIYKPSVVTCTGSSIADNSVVHNRPPLAQTFIVNNNQEKFSVLVNHFKSKGCTGASGLNADQLDGQGCYNDSRKQQALALLSFIASVKTQSGDNDVLAIGDFNAYEQEDPIDVLVAGGLVHLLNNTYSYVFDGQSGSLDHAFGSISLAAQVKGADKWHINSDEPVAKDYNQEFNPPYLYSADPFRSSDHDPVLIGLDIEPAVSLTVSTTSSVACFGQATGAAAVTASGGYGPLTYSWLPAGGSTTTASGLASGVYTVSVSDGTTSATKTLTIAQPSSSVGLSIVNQTSVTCNGGNNAAATVLASGGTGTINYLWTPGGTTTASISSLSAGIYTITATDLNLCSNSKTVAILEPLALTTTVSGSTSVTCNGYSNGSATVAAAGGNGNYTYSWSPSGGTASSTGSLSFGNYTVQVTDANLCVTVQTLSIAQPPALSLTAVGINSVSCFGFSNGSASIAVSGGTGAYSYSWSPSGGNGATTTSLSSGIYTVTVQDVNACVTSKTVSITQPAPVSSSLVGISGVSCNGLSNGSGTVSASGGTGTYSYSWSPTGGSGSTASFLTAGNYTITIMDANSCSATQTLTITQPPAIVVSIVNYSNVSCYGLANGSATASATGGSGILSYSWSPNASIAANASQLTPGVYTITVSDGNLCSTSQTVSISQPAPIDVSTTTNGSQITANASGLSYQWMNCNTGNSPIIGANGQTYTTSSNGSYAVIVSTAMCSDTSACVSINLTGIEKLIGISETVIYPNPTSGGLTIDTKGVKIEFIKVYNHVGQLVLSSFESGETPVNLSLKDLPAGMYFLHLDTAHGTSIKKIIKSN